MLRSLLLVGWLALAQPGVPVSESEVTQGDPEVPNVALVFNVGAGYTPAPAILDTLAERGYRATFFVMGWWAERPLTRHLRPAGLHRGEPAELA